MMIESRDGQVIITLPKCVLVMPRAQFIEALRAGKAYRRGQAMAARVATAGGEASAGTGRMARTR